MTEGSGIMEQRPHYAPTIVDARTRLPPTACPRSFPRLLAAGAKNLAPAKAVVTNLTDVETLGVASGSARTPLPAVDPKRVAATDAAHACPAPRRPAV
jgi:hypothetical protein